MQKFKFALGWDTDLDIDCSVLLCSKFGNVIENVYYGKLKSKNNAVVHGGDNRDGKGRGDDETITINLGLIPEEVESIWPVISVFTDGL